MLRWKKEDLVSKGRTRHHCLFSAQTLWVSVLFLFVPLSYCRLAHAVVFLMSSRLHGKTLRPSAPVFCYRERFDTPRAVTSL